MPEPKILAVITAKLVRNKFEEDGDGKQQLCGLLF